MGKNKGDNMFVFCVIISMIIMFKLHLNSEKNHQREIVKLKIQALKSDLKNYKFALDEMDIKLARLGFHPDVKKLEREGREEIQNNINTTEFIYTKINGWYTLDELYDKYY